MGWRQRPESDGVNIDPFNAPDPVMPGGEPDFARDPAEGDADGIERVVRRNERREPGHFRHRAGSDWHRSPKTPGPSMDGRTAARTQAPEGSPAPSPIADAEAAERRAAEERRVKRADARRQIAKAERRAGKTRGKGSGGRRLGCIIALVVIVATGVIGPLISCSAVLLDGIFDDGSSGYDYIYEYDYTDGDATSPADWDALDAADEGAAELARTTTEESLQAMVACDQACVDAVSERFAESFESWTSVSPEEAGIDADAVARWALENMTYEVDADSVSAYATDAEDGDGYDVPTYIDASVSCPDLGDVVMGLREVIVDQTDLWSGEPLDDADRELIADELDRLMADTAFADGSLYLSYDVAADAEGTPRSIELTSHDGITEAVAPYFF